MRDETAGDAVAGLCLGEGKVRKRYSDTSSYVSNEAEPPRMSGTRGRGTRLAVKAFVA